MAKTYRKSHATRLINSLSRTLTRFGLGPPYLHILTVQGRKTGRRYSTPVMLVFRTYGLPRSFESYSLIA